MHPAELSRHSSGLNIRKAMSIGLASLACAAASPAQAPAETLGTTPQTDPATAATAQKLQYALRHHEALPVDIDHDILWSDPHSAPSQYEYITKAPLVAQVTKADGNTTNRYFAVTRADKAGGSLRVEALPQRATRVADISHYRVPPYGTVLPDSRALTAIADKQQQPFVKLEDTNERPGHVVIGATNRAPTQLTSEYGGKRFASTAAINNLASAHSIPQADKAMQVFLNQYNLKSDMFKSSSDSVIVYKALSPRNLTELKEYGKLFIDEWSKYPLDWVTHSHLGAIAIIKDLNVNGTDRAASFSIAAKTMYYDATDYSYTGSEPTDDDRESLHHEFDHFITYNLFGSFVNPDPAWETFNPPGFQYGNGGAACYQDPDACLAGDHPRKGFVSGYAMAAIEEDQAETYGYLMTNPDYKKTQLWAKDDPYLAKKLVYYKQFIAKITPQMSGNYFSQINP